MCLFLKKVDSPFLSFSFGKVQENMLSDLADRVTARLMLGFLYYLAEVSAPSRKKIEKNLHICIYIYIFALEIGIVGEMHIVSFSLNKHTRL